MPLAEIASRTGFNNEYYLSRQFTKLIGQPPHKFRKAKKLQKPG
jgi:transcriptional regulator GlxA family with amidase domain